MAVSLVPAKTGSLVTGGFSDTWSNLGPGSGVTEGDIIIVAVTTEGSHDLASIPAGWTQLGTTVKPGTNPGDLSVIARRASPSETGLVTVTFVSARRATVAWCVLTGVDGTTMLDVAVAIGTSGFGTAKDLGIATVTDGAGLLMINASDPSTTIDMTWDAGITAVVDADVSGTGHIDMGFVAQATAGATSMGGDWSTGRGGAHMLIAFKAGTYTPVVQPGWVRASSLLSASEDAQVGIISTSAKSGSSIGVSAVISGMPVASPSSLWLVDSATGPANGYELEFDTDSMTLRSVVDGEATQLTTGATSIGATDEVSLVIVDGVVAGFVGLDQIVYSAQAAQVGPWYAGLEAADDALLISSVNFGIYSGTAPDDPEVPPEPEPPLAAVSLAAWESEPGVIRVDFTMPTAPATGYAIRYKSGSGQVFSGETDGTAFASGTAAAEAAVSVPVAGFTPGQSYTIGVWIIDSATGLFSEVATATVALAAYPQPPSSVTLTRSGTTLTAAFTMPSVNVTGYVARYKEGLGQSFTGPTDGLAFDDSAALPSEAVQSQSGVVFPDGVYTVAVWAINGSIPSQTYASDDVSVATFSAITAAAVSETSATISWTSTPASTGSVEYGTTQALGTVKESTAGVSTTHTVQLNGLTPSSRYYYRITAEF